MNVETIAQLGKVIDLKYEVTYQESTEGLDKVEDVDLVPSDPVEVQTVCSEPQCEVQRTVIRDIYSYYEVDFDSDKHECLFDGINCNIDNLATHI